MDIFDSLSPLDFRYYGRNEKHFKSIQPYLSESGFIKYLAKVESALVNTLAKNNICSEKIAKEVSTASDKVTAQDVYEEEDKIKHNIRALANVIRKNVSDEAKRFVHFSAT